jgi:hypothetical protein
LHDVCRLAGLVPGDHQVTVEGLDPEPPAFWQLQLAAESGRALFRGQARPSSSEKTMPAAAAARGVRSPAPVISTW